MKQKRQSGPISGKSKARTGGSVAASNTAPTTTPTTAAPRAQGPAWWQWLGGIIILIAGWYFTTQNMRAMQERVASRQ
jgi:hypothetical protein